MILPLVLCHPIANFFAFSQKKNMINLYSYGFFFLIKMTRSTQQHEPQLKSKVEFLHFCSFFSAFDSSHFYFDICVHFLSLHLKLLQQRFVYRPLHIFIARINSINSSSSARTIMYIAFISQRICAPNIHTYHFQKIPAYPFLLGLIIFRFHFCKWKKS